ncbi:MAG: hypothetical protein RLZZ360_792 [Candidatus Parcubacteria bacterium]|jgi:predicted ATPase
MKVIGIELQSVKGFKSLPKTDFSESINIFIGENNSGKSTILNAIHLIQKREALNMYDQTVGNINGLVKLYTAGSHPGFSDRMLGFVFHLNGNQRHILTHTGEAGWNGAANQSEPDNLIYPYLSKRKVVTYSPDVNKGAANSVVGNFTHLYAKIDRLSDPEASWYQEYVEACDEILGFRISTSGGEGNGKQAVYKLGGFDEIPMTSMGEGIPNLLGLIADLCVAKNKIFIIEEPENDIHPKALKSLLSLIARKSETNQFFVSTHSNIVMRMLGASSNAKVFEVSTQLSDAERPKLFVSQVKEIKTSKERMDALENLGYEFFDYGQYMGYLFLEESSAELIIREYIIPWFIPNLNQKIRTHSSAGKSKIEMRFEEFNNLFVFVHLEPIYRNKAWVILDGGESEAAIIEKFKAKYVVKDGWKEENFLQFNEHDFEEYYPKIFKDKFNSEIRNDTTLTKEEKRLKKINLLIEVKDWVSNDEEEAKKQFALSATEVIEKLKQIDASLHA